MAWASKFHDHHKFCDNACNFSNNGIGTFFDRVLLISACSLLIDAEWQFLINQKKVRKSRDFRKDYFDGP